MLKLTDTLAFSTPIYFFSALVIMSFSVSGECTGQGCIYKVNMLWKHTESKSVLMTKKFGVVLCGKSHLSSWCFQL